MTEPTTRFTFTGVLAGPVVVPEPIALGLIDVWTEQGEVQFSGAVTLPRPVDSDDVLRVTRSVEGALAAAVEVSVRATITRWDSHSNTDSGNLHGGVLSFSYSSSTVLSRGLGQERGRIALEALLGGRDERLAELFEVYLLGLQGMSIAPVVGLWAFSAILEEKAGQQTLKHVRHLAAELTAAGYDLPPKPERHPAAIRAAALHTAPTAPPPSREEVQWFQKVAHAYLLNRARAAADPPSAPIQGFRTAH